MKVQTNGIIAIHQADSTVMIHPLKMRGLIQGLAKRRATLLKPKKIRIYELSHQPEKSYTFECMACYDPSMQLHSCFWNNPQKKVDRNFDNAFELVDLWLDKETTFEKMKDKIHVAVKDKDLHLRCSDLLRNVFFMDLLKAAVMKLVL